MFFVFIVFFVISLILAGLRGVLRLGAVSRASLSPFECGFSSVGPVCSSFRLHSYSVILVFVIFDLELCILLGFLLGRGVSLWLFFFYIFFIYLTYYIEVTFGSLSWVFFTNYLLFGLIIIGSRIYFILRSEHLFA